MCRALLVLCLAPTRDALTALRRAVVSSEWELTAGATTEEEALAQLALPGAAHVLVVAGGRSRDLVARAREVRPGLRVVSVGPLEGADAQVASLQEVRDAVVGRRRGGPVRSP